LTISYFIQVLTGETPFRGVRITELGYAVVAGERPGKPPNALAIGFSDSLWDFVQRCWDGDKKLRPKVAEVVTHLEEAVAGWVGLMPPYAQVENVASEFKEPMSDSMQHCEFGIFTPPLYLSSSNGTVGLFPSPPGVALKSPTESKNTSAFNFPSIQSTRVPMQPQPEEPYDDIDLGVVTYPHLNKRHNVLPSQLQKKRKGFKRFKEKLRGLFSFGR
jgi:hypothetical protein